MKKGFTEVDLGGQGDCGFRVIGAVMNRVVSKEIRSLLLPALLVVRLHHSLLFWMHVFLCVPIW